MMFGSDCTHWDKTTELYCGAPAKWARFVGDPGVLIDVVCDVHREYTDVEIPLYALRAPRAEDRTGRFLHP